MHVNPDTYVAVYIYRTTVHYTGIYTAHNLRFFLVPVRTFCPRHLNEVLDHVRNDLHVVLQCRIPAGLVDRRQQLLRLFDLRSWHPHWCTKGPGGRRQRTRNVKVYIRMAHKLIPARGHLFLRQVWSPEKAEEVTRNEHSEGIIDVVRWTGVVPEMI